MARKPAAANPARDRFIARCVSDYAAYYVVRKYAESPTREVLEHIAAQAGLAFDAAPDLFSAPEAAPEPVEIGKR